MGLVGCFPTLHRRANALRRETLPHVVPQRDVDTLAHRLRQLAEQPTLRRHLGQAARAKDLACFSAEQNARKLLDRINKLGTTVIMSTHDAQIVDQMRRRVIELDTGHIVRDQSRGVYGYAR